MNKPTPAASRSTKPAVCVATTVHPDFDARVFRHASSLAALGYHVDLVCPWPDARADLPPGLRLIQFPRGSGPLRTIQVYRRVWPLLRRRPYDIYHFHDFDGLPLFALLRLLTKRVVVYDCHENYAEEVLYRPYPIPGWLRPTLAACVRLFERFFAAIVRNVVLVVPGQAALFKGGSYRTVLVRNFADRELSRGRRDDHDVRPPACISTASQYVENGARLLVDVALEVTRTRQDIRFLSVDRYRSNLALRSEVVDRTRSLAESGLFRLLPNVPAPEVMGHLNQATIGLALDLPTPSRIKALPIKLFEYMAAGLPIVAADLPQIREFVEQGRCGLLVEPGNPRAFSEAICRLVDDPALARELGSNGLAAFRDRFNWEAEVEKLVTLYDAVLPTR